MLRQAEIYFNDLNERGKKKLLEAAGINDPKENNWDMDILPIAICDFEVEED